MVVELKHLLIGPVNRLALVRDLSTILVKQTVDLVYVYVLKVF